ncbi:MAG: FeoB small GTPase domain-containing protein, partial [Planctomycetota bacterium]
MASSKTLQNLTVALAGNPNSGKTTVFNALVGTRHRVANYPGVTVEKKEGRCHHSGHELNFVDLPGTYSLTAYSTEELVARHFILDGQADVVVDILDASNIERHLYLATQLMEMQVPLVLAFNMSDVARAKGLEFDLKKLEILLGVRIVPMVASKREGVNELLDAIIETIESPQLTPTSLQYGDEVEEELSLIGRAIAEHPEVVGAQYPPRWIALKLLEGDKEALGWIQDATIQEVINKSREHLKEIFGDNADIIIADRRYGFISGACQETVKDTVQARHDISDMIDRFLTNRYVGLPIFGGLMFLVFYLTFTIGAYPMGW